MKKYSKIILNLIIVLLVFLLIYARFINPISIFKVVSGSMSPEIMEGDVIITKKCKSYEVGDIITFFNDEEIITHRINAIIGEDYYTKGDSNNTVDLETIKTDQIYGKVIFHFHSIFGNYQNSSSKYTDLQTFHVNAEMEDLCQN